MTPLSILPWWLFISLALVVGLLACLAVNPRGDDE